MKKLNKLIKNKRGSSLVEILIATAVLVIISSGIMAALLTSTKTTVVNEDIRYDHERAVGRMDTYIDAADTSIGTDITVNVKFGYDNSTNTVDCVKIYQSNLPGAELVGFDPDDMQGVGIIKKK